MLVPTGRQGHAGCLENAVDLPVSGADGDGKQSADHPVCQDSRRPRAETTLPSIARACSRRQDRSLVHPSRWETPISPPLSDRSTCRQFQLR